MTFIALGIIKKDRKVLLCRRSRAFLYGNLWEFPTTVVEPGKTIEDALEQWVFESTGWNCSCENHLLAIDGPNCRIFPVVMSVKNEKKSLQYYDFCKLLKYKELRRFRMSFPSVIFIKSIKNL